MSDQFNTSEISLASRHIVTTNVGVPQSVLTLIAPENPRRTLVIVQAGVSASGAAEFFIQDGDGVGGAIGIVISSLANSIYPNLIELPTRDSVYAVQTVLLGGVVNIMEFTS